MTDHEEILYWQQGTDGFFLNMNGLRPVSIHMGFMPNHVLLKREHAFLSVEKKQSKHIYKLTKPYLVKIRLPHFHGKQASRNVCFWP